MKTVMNILIAQGVLSFITDFLCAAFPVVLLRNLHIKKQSKIGLCCLMGLGIITGGIAIARVATARQVLSRDLSWVSVPNSMTRVFEVNIGNSAACVPILKPFVRYLNARVTGRDPHEMLPRRRTSPPSSPSSPAANWYSKRLLWLRRPSRAYTRSERGLKKQVVVVPAEVQRAAWSPALTKKSLDTEMTLELPLQGVRESFFEMGVPHLRGHDDGKDGLGAPGMQGGQGSEGSLSKEGEEVRDVKDII